MNVKLEQMMEKRKTIMMGGGQSRIDKQHEKGKLTARERVDLFLDEGSFVECGLWVKHRCTRFGMDKTETPAEGIVTGFGTVDGRKVFVYAHDFTVMGGALGEMQGAKLIRLQEMAMEAKAPIVGLNDSGGARLQEGPDASVYGSIFYNNVMASGVIPQISAIMGPCAGGAAYSPALTDFTIMVDKTSQTFITGPAVIKSVTGETVDAETLGGAHTHNSLSGVAHLIASDDEHCLELIKCLMSFFPSNCDELPPIYPTEDSPDRYDEFLNDIVPENSRKAYDVKEIITTIADDNYFFETQPLFAKNIVVGFIRLDGMPVGVIANQTKWLAGCLDIDASCKASRFIRTCDAFNIPLLSIIDVSGYLPGVNQEYGGIIRHGAKMLYAWSEATVPKLVVAVGKVYGGASPAMCSSDMKPDVSFAWPSTQRAVMGAEGAVNVLYKKEIEKAENPEKSRAKYIEAYKEEFMNPYRAAEHGKYEDIIEPAETRMKLIQVLHTFWGKKKATPLRKHGNIPL